MKPRGNGRSATLTERQRAAEKALEGVYGKACRPSGAPMPPWMRDPSLLPKKPPGVQA
jgi:hypothetical protein